MIYNYWGFALELRNQLQYYSGQSCNQERDNHASYHAPSYSLIFTNTQSFFPLFSFLQHLIWEIFKQIFMTFASIIIIEESLSNWGTNCGQSRDICEHIMQSVPRHLRTHHVDSPATFANTSCGQSRDIHAPYHAISPATFANTSCNQSRDIRKHIMQSGTRHSCMCVSSHAIILSSFFILTTSHSREIQINNAIITSFIIIEESPLNWGMAHVLHDGLMSNRTRPNRRSHVKPQRPNHRSHVKA
jgi:hypothetical protein